jgi:hypothetical protein
MTDTATNVPASNEAPATEPASAPFGELSEFEHALGNVLRAVRDLDEDDTRRVLLAVSELYGLNLWHNAPSSDPLIRVSSAVKLIDAARGAQ